MKLLHIDSSILGKQSASRRAHAGDHRVSGSAAPCRYGRSHYLDLAVDTPSHLSMESLGFRLPAKPSDTLSDAQQRENAGLRGAGHPVPGGRCGRHRCAAVQLRDPEPAQVLDRPHCAGRSHLHLYRQGPERPGRWQDRDRRLDTWRRVFDHRGRPRDGAPGESYLQTVFGFLGITDVRFVRAEGLAMGAGRQKDAMALAALTRSRPWIPTQRTRPQVAKAA
jgi:FMN-dependent NADH-azoreductase